MTDDKVVQLIKTPVQHDIVAGLRRLADNLEREGAAAYDMDAVSTVHVILGHTRTVPANNGSEDLEQSCEWTTFSWGPRCDPFTVRGLMATVLNK